MFKLKCITSSPNSHMLFLARFLNAACSVMHRHSTVADDNGTREGNVILMQNPTPNPLKIDSFLIHHFAGVLSFSTLMVLPLNVLSTHLLFTFPQLSPTNLIQCVGERYK